MAKPKKRNRRGRTGGSRKAQSGGLQGQYKALLARLAKENPLSPGHSRVLVEAHADGRVGESFVYLFRTPDGGQTVAAGPFPTRALPAVANAAELVDTGMAAHLRHLHLTCRAEQCGIGGRA